MPIGNVDYREWHHQEYVNFLRDTDKVMAAFYEFCHRAGPTGCDFYADTPELIQERYDHLLETIRQHPVIVPADGKLGATGPSMPQVITWSHVRRLTSSALYQPMALFKKFAAALATLEVGDGRLVYQMSRLISSSSLQLFINHELFVTRRLLSCVYCSAMIPSPQSILYH